MRVRVFRAAILFFFAILVFGLFYNQIWKYDFYRKKSENNRIRVVPLEAPRGKIYDRKKKLLVTNRIAFDVEVVFQEIKNKEKVARLLSDVLGLDKAVLAEKIEKARKVPYAPFKIAQDIQKDKAIQIEELKFDLPGVIVTS